MKPIRSALYLLAVVGVALFWQYSPISNNDDVARLTSTGSEEIISDSVDVKIVNILEDTIDVPNHRMSHDTLGWFTLPEHSTQQFNLLKLALESGQDSLQRILFYGDSQIETDHLTGSFRDLIQEKFGGSGIGYLPRPDIYNTREGLSVHFDGFEYCEMGSAQEPLGGMWGREFNVSQEVPFIKIRPFQTKDSIYNLNIYYEGSCVLHLKKDGKVESVHYLESNDSQDMFRLQSDIMSGSSILEFHDCTDFKLYGVQLNQPKGVVVDHVPFRGARGLQTYRFDKRSMRKCFDDQNVPLIVLYFGVNIGIGEFDSYDDYGVEVEKQIKLLKQASPQSVIVTIGCSDMAKVQAGSIVSVQGIDRLVEVQKSISKKNGALFWDLYKCMGGQASAIAWRNEGLINADYIHFSKDGAEFIAKELFRDLNDILKETPIEINEFAETLLIDELL